MLKTLRSSIVSWTNIKDDTGELLPVTEETQKAVFDVVVSKQKLLERIMKAYAGLSTKN